MSDVAKLGQRAATAGKAVNFLGGGFGLYQLGHGFLKQNDAEMRSGSIGLGAAIGGVVIGATSVVGALVFGAAAFAFGLLAE